MNTGNFHFLGDRRVEFQLHYSYENTRIGVEDVPMTSIKVRRCIHGIFSMNTCILNLNKPFARMNRRFIARKDPIAYELRLLGYVQ